MERLPDRDGRTARIEPGTQLFELIEIAPLQRMVTRIADSTLPFGGTWTYQLSAIGDGCMIAIIENGDVRNPLFRFMSRFLFGHDATINAGL